MATRALTPAALDRFGEALRFAGAPLIEQLQPGLTDAEIDALGESLGVVVPPDLRTLWAWGVVPELPQHQFAWAAAVGCDLLPPSQVVSTTLALREEPEMPDHEIAFAGKFLSVLLTETADGNQAGRVAHRTFIDPGQATPMPTIGELVEQWTTKILDGEYWYDAAQGWLSGETVAFWAAQRRFLSPLPNWTPLRVVAAFDRTVTALRVASVRLSAIKRRGRSLVAPPVTPEMLEHFAEALNFAGAPLIDELGPGLTDAELGELEAALGVSVPPELRTLWQWGTPPESPLTHDSWDLNPLVELWPPPIVVERTQFEREDPEFSELQIVFARAGNRRLSVVGDADSRVSAVLDDDVDPVLVAPSIGTLIDRWTKQMLAGEYWYDGEPNWKPHNFSSDVILKRK